jgi:hypothetical protein
MKLLRFFTRAATAAHAPTPAELEAVTAGATGPAANDPWHHEPKNSRQTAGDDRASAGTGPAAAPFSGEVDALAAADAKASEFTLPRPALRTPGLLNVPELAAYFGTNHHASGRYHGCRYRSEHAREQGLAALVTTFQNTVSEMAERRLARIDRLRLSRHDVAGLGGDLGAKIDLACAQAQREVEALREQLALAAQGQGWVLDALNRYRLGFDRGVREAVDFELLDA